MLEGRSQSGDISSADEKCTIAGEEVSADDKLKEASSMLCGRHSRQVGHQGRKFETGNC